MGKTFFLLIIIVLLSTACNLPLSASSSAVNTEPKFIGTVKQDTFCYLGPDPTFGVAAALKTDLKITIVGASSEGDYAVIKDPANPGKICWAEIRDIALSSEDLIAEFMRLGAEDPGSSDSEATYLSPIFVELHPPSTNCKERQKEGEGDSGGSVYACHSQAEFDYYCAECGEWVYPAYVIPINCEDDPACVTPTPLQPVFMACTPTSPLSGWSAEVASDPTPTFGSWSAEVASDPTPTFGSWSAEVASSPTPPSITPTPIPPSIPDLTLCWNGPGPGYEVISSLKPGTTVEVLGTGEGGGYIVVNNPTYNRPCWVEEKDIELYGFDVADMPIFEIPQVGADTPDNPVLGCLVAENINQAPQCTLPCPDPVKYPVTCTP